MCCQANSSNLLIGIHAKYQNMSGIIENIFIGIKKGEYLASKDKQEAFKLNTDKALDLNS